MFHWTMIMGERVVLTLISNAFFLACFITPPQSFRETRFTNFKAYSMLIFHHFISPRTTNPPTKGHIKIGAPSHAMSPQKTPMTLGKLANFTRTFRCDYLLKASSDQIFFQRKRWSISCWKWLDLLVQKRCFGILGPKMGDSKKRWHKHWWMVEMDVFFLWGGGLGGRERNVKHFDLQWNGEFLLEGNWQRPFCTQFQDGEMLSCQIVYFAPTNISKTKTHQG